MDKKIVAFMDILGFSNYVNENPAYAMDILHNYQYILKTKIIDYKCHPPDSYDDEELKRLVEIDSVTSFDYFLPLSDSVFIIAHDPDLFLRQMSRFILGCFVFLSEIYKHPENPKMPTEVTCKYPRKLRGNEIEFEKIKTKWQPILFRGGICLGDVYVDKLPLISNNNVSLTDNLLGSAVIKAVALEKGGKGPRLFCNDEFVKSLSDDSKMYIGENVFGKEKSPEILWPAFEYFPRNDFHSEIHKFDDLFIPAANLWKAFNHEEYGVHYYYLMKLVVISTLKYFNNLGRFNVARNYVVQVIKNTGLEDKLDNLTEV